MDSKKIQAILSELKSLTAQIEELLEDEPEKETEESEDEDNEVEDKEVSSKASEAIRVIKSKLGRK